MTLGPIARKLTSLPAKNFVSAFSGFTVPFLGRSVRAQSSMPSNPNRVVFAPQASLAISPMINVTLQPRSLHHSPMTRIFYRSLSGVNLTDEERTHLDSHETEEVLAHPADKMIHTTLKECKVSYKQKIAAIEEFVAAGGNVNDYDSKGHTALYYALTSSTNDIGRHKIVKKLLKHGAKINHHEFDFDLWPQVILETDTRYRFTIRKPKIVLTVKVLMEHGVNINLRSKKGQTALDFVKNKTLFEDWGSSAWYKFRDYLERNGALTSEKLREITKVPS